MSLKFGLNEMENTLQVALQKTTEYSEAIEAIDANINALGNSLVSKETGIYEELMSKYSEKKQALFEARNHMNKFCNKLNEKIMEFDDASNKIKRSLQ